MKKARRNGQEANKNQIGKEKSRESDLIEIKSRAN